MCLQDIYLEADNRLFSLNLKYDLAVSILVVLYVHSFE